MVKSGTKHIQVGFWANDLFCDDREAEPGYDVTASANSYAKILCKALSDAFPGAEVTVNIGRCVTNTGHCGTGHLPHYLQTRVNDLSYHPDTNLVSAIRSEVFEGFQWPVKKKE